MRESEFRIYVESIDTIYSKNKTVNSRISRENTAEMIIGENIDYVVADDMRMYEALKKVALEPRERSGNVKNAVRWYYLLCNSKDFPRMSVYKK